MTDEPGTEPLAFAGLPNEEAASAVISRDYGHDIVAMSALLTLVVEMLSHDWNVPACGLNRTVVETVIGLFVKAAKTFRSIQVLTQRGLTDDANALMRVLMETNAAILYILQKRSREPSRERAGAVSLHAKCCGSP